LYNFTYLFLIPLVIGFIRVCLCELPFIRSQLSVDNGSALVS